MSSVSTFGLGRPAIGRCSGTVALLFTTMLIFAPCARAQDNDAKTLLKNMSDYVASQKSISFSYDSDIEVITSDLQKIQFTSSGKMQLSRPNKAHATRTGGYADVEFFFDGKTFTFFGKHLNAFAQSESAGSIDELIDRLGSEYSVEAPGADLLLSNAYDKLIDGVIDAKHIGLGVIDGIECEHLALSLIHI